MIARVLAALRDCGVLHDNTDLVFNVLLSGQAVCRVALPGDAQFVMAKVTAPPALAKAQDFLQLDLNVEYQALACANQVLGGRVPRAISLYEQQQWQVLITGGIEHTPVSAMELARPVRAVQDDLIAYFRDSRAEFLLQPTQTVPHRELLDGVIEEFVEYRSVSNCASWLADQGEAFLHALPLIRQHCDFVVNNIGCTAGGLVYFDWEDFGRITFPGLDLATLVFSSLGNDTQQVSAFASNPSAFELYPVVHATCDLYGLSVTDFCHLLPIYAAIFLRLKRSRSPVIQNAFSSLLSGLR